MSATEPYGAVGEPVNRAIPDGRRRLAASAKRGGRSGADERRLGGVPLRVVPEGEAAQSLLDAPPGRWLDLGRRGRTWIREEPGPPDAPSLVLLHGLGATGGLNWAGSQHFLRDRFRVITLDHRGHGRGIRTRDFRLEDCADDAAAVIEALQLDRPIAVGYSMGGPIASLLWRRHPHLLGGLVFCATSRNFRGSTAEKLAFWGVGVAGLAPVALPTRLTRGIGSAFCALPHPGPLKDLQFAVDEMAGHDSRSIMQAAATLGRFDSSRWIGDVDVPTAVIATTKDQLVPAYRQLRLARSIPQASLHCLPIGHLGIAGGPSKSQFLSELRTACLEVADARSVRQAVTRAGGRAQPARRRR